MQHAFPHLKETKGSVINFASELELWVILLNHLRCKQLKEAIRGLSRTVANEWGQYEINVNVITISNAEEVKLGEKLNQSTYERENNVKPLRRFGDAEDIDAPWYS